MKGYLLTSSEKPTPGYRPKGKNLGYTIAVTTVKPCPYGCKCYRKRWWVQPWDQGGDIGKSVSGKPKTHWHIPFGAKWRLDSKTMEFLV